MEQRQSNSGPVARFLRKHTYIITCLILILVYIVLIFPQFSVVRISGNSMLPTILPDQFLVGLRTTGYATPQPQNGDIVLAVNEQTGNRIVIKRLIASPGDTIQILNNQVYRNGQLLQEPYLYEEMVTEDLAIYTLGEDEYFLLGDNRNISADSRLRGYFHTDELIGIVPLEHQTLLWVILGGITLVLFCAVWVLSGEADKRIARERAEKAAHTDEFPEEETKEP